MNSYLYNLILLPHSGKHTPASHETFSLMVWDEREELWSTGFPGNVRQPYRSIARSVKSAILLTERCGDGDKTYTVY